MGRQGQWARMRLEWHQAQVTADLPSGVLCLYWGKTWSKEREIGEFGVSSEFPKAKEGHRGS